VLTGDKQETAINVGYACNLLNNEMEVLVINEESQEATNRAIEESILRYQVFLYFPFFGKAWC